MARITILILIFMFPLVLQAQVYRCESPTGSVYSQIPCDENAERLAKYDPVVKADDNPDSEANEIAAEKQLSPMENFVTTLHNQQAQQVGEIDKNIALMQKAILPWKSPTENILNQTWKNWKTSARPSSSNTLA